MEDTYSPSLRIITTSREDSHAWQADIHAHPAPAWLIPSPSGFKAEDLDTMPDLPLIDGNLVLVSPQKGFHSVVVDLFALALRRTAP